VDGKNGLLRRFAPRNDEAGAVLILIFHFGVVFGHNEVYAFVVQHSEKPSIPRYSVGVPVPDSSDRADLTPLPCAFGNGLIGTRRSLCGHLKNVPLAAHNSDWFDIFEFGVQTGDFPRLVESAPICQIATEGFDSRVIGPRIHEREPNKLMSFVV
jgi:hypothetical protein